MIIQSATQAANGASSVAVSFGALPTPGNSIIATFNCSNAVQISTLTDNQSGNTYGSVVIEKDTVDGNDAEIWWLSSVVGSSGTFTVTATVSGSYNIQLTIMEVSGLTAVDKTGTATSGGSRATTLTVTGSAQNANANDLVVATLSGSYGPTPTGNSNPCTSGYTSLYFSDGNSSTYGNIAQGSYKTVSGVETSSATWTNTANSGAGSYLTAVIATFKGPTSTAPIAWIT